MVVDFAEMVETVANLQRLQPDLWIETADKLPRLANVAGYGVFQPSPQCIVIQLKYSKDNLLSFTQWHWGPTEERSHIRGKNNKSGGTFCSEEAQFLRAAFDCREPSILSLSTDLLQEVLGLPLHIPHPGILE